MSPTWLKRVAFTAAFFFFLAIGLWLTAPTRILNALVEAQAERALRFRYNVEIERTAISGLGLSMTGVLIEPPGVPTEGPIEPSIRLDRIRAGVGLWSLLTLSPRLLLDVRVDEGRIVASYAQPGEGANANVAFYDVDLRRFAPIRRLTSGMPVQGFLRGTVDVAWNPDWAIQTGAVELQISQLVVGPGAIRSASLRQVGGEIPLPATDFGTLVVRGHLAEGVFELESLEASGTDARLGAEGRLELRNPTSTSLLHLTLRFSLDQAYVEEAGLGAVFSMVDFLQRAQSGDGYALQLSGPIGNLGPPEPLGGGRSSPRRPRRANPDE